MFFTDLVNFYGKLGPIFGQSLHEPRAHVWSPFSGLWCHNIVSLDNVNEEGAEYDGDIETEEETVKQVFIIGYMQEKNMGVSTSC